ncbi:MULTISPECIES: ABC transporter ATP-binding protein [Bacillus]|uniref:ABC-2 type transport system ATP-binding protein n=1 Tax=Bacillus mycoides TaxID=1405 RepID=A0A3D9VAR1_BACMY|nr:MULTISPECIES: ATP-binding cassette domain-containing protein [Bacillus]RBP24970.1 ABC-2 type transport system ATP-binding protein [Bacillus sp. DB-2]REF38549.1 ABC-2 type transport system ATP-binding protein [Bacillus mycoides]
MKVIQVKNLSKSYKVPKPTTNKIEKAMSLFYRKYNQIDAVKNISFDIEQGEIVGYIGKNGAGKSTTIKMLTGVLMPSNGAIEINGFDPYIDRRKISSEIGVVFGQRTQLWWDLPLIDSFKLLRDIYGISEQEFRRKISQFDDVLNLQSLLNKPVRLMSLGERMRCDIAASLLHNPKVLFLDEPTIGLDIEAKEEIREFIKIMNREKKVTVILTTHDMSDIEKLCSRIMFIDDGQIFFDGSQNELKELYGGMKSINLITQNPVIIPDEFRDVLEINKKSNYNIEIFYSKKDLEISDVLIPFFERNIIQEMEVSEENIERVISKLFRSLDAATTNNMKIS